MKVREVSFTNNVQKKKKFSMTMHGYEVEKDK